MRLSPARAADAARLGRIMGGWAEETPWMPRLHTPTEDVGHLDMLIARFHVTVLRNWRGAQGFLARDEAMIHAFYLAPEMRGRGWGQRLIDRAKGQCDRLELWCFQANAGALRFYARMGFVEVERTDGAGNDEKLPDVRLVWPGPEETR